MSSSYDEWKLRSDRDEYPDMEGDRPEPECDCDGGWVACPKCHGEGWYVTCIDDMCRGAGECLHGDGERTCPLCLGDGSIACDCEHRASGETEGTEK